jgi:hypothetical protein
MAHSMEPNFPPIFAALQWSSNILMNKSNILMMIQSSQLCIGMMFAASLSPELEGDVATRK